MSGLLTPINEWHPQAVEAVAASFATAKRRGAQADKICAYATQGGFGLLRSFGKAVRATLLTGAVGAFLRSAIDQLVKN
ncbi:MAG: hypothetical protein H7251_16040 [Acetobacteraceae bacterium]|nr:hypothetical protein [Acetobacteraceae bacterium]